MNDCPDTLEPWRVAASAFVLCVLFLSLGLAIYATTRKEKGK